VLQAKIKHQKRSIMRLSQSFTLAFVLVAILFIPRIFAANTAKIRIKIDTVPDEYLPTNLTVTERVSMQEFHFEVNPETRRARIVVNYTYPDELMYERNDDNGGPRPTIAQIPGLGYDMNKQEVLYEGNGRQVVCARVEDHHGIFGHHLRVKSTGLCSVSAEDTKHAEDDGWAIQRYRAIDTYFEVH